MVTSSRAWAVAFAFVLALFVAGCGQTKVVYPETPEGVAEARARSFLEGKCSEHVQYVRSAEVQDALARCKENAKLPKHQVEVHCVKEQTESATQVIVRCNETTELEMHGGVVKVPSSALLRMVRVDGRWQ